MNRRLGRAAGAFGRRAAIKIGSSRGFPRSLAWGLLSVRARFDLRRREELWRCPSMFGQTLREASSRDSDTKLGPVAPCATAVPMRHARLQHDCPAFSMFCVQVGIEKPLGTASSPGRGYVVRRLRPACFAVGLAACAPAKTPEIPDRATVSRPELPFAERIGPVSHWDSVEAAAVPVRLRLPSAPTWKRSETKTSMQLELTSERTRISIRLWSSAKLTNVDQCYAELSLLEPELAKLQQLVPGILEAEELPPAPEATGVVAHEPRAPQQDEPTIVAQSFDPNADFHGRLRARAAWSKPDEVTGGVVAVAAGIRRCLAFVASTSSGGPQAAAQVGDRLAWIVDGVAKSVRIRTPEDRLLPPAINR